MSGCNSQLCAAKSRWQPWHVQRQWIHPRNHGPLPLCRARTAWATNSCLPPLPGQDSSLLTRSWVHPLHIQSIQSLPVQVSHCRHFAIRGKQATCLKQPPKHQEGSYVVFSIQAETSLRASNMLTYKSRLNCHPPSLLPLTMRLFLFLLFFVSLFPTSLLPLSAAQLLFCHHHWNCFQSCWLLPWATAVLPHSKKHGLYCLFSLSLFVFFFFF